MAVRLKREDEGAVPKRLMEGLRWGIVGAIPGLILVLLAQFVIEGEMQLTVGAPGTLLAIAGALVGFTVGLRRAARRK
ncbi:MAG TPA: hypothetical protein VHJ40_07725 [Actinomycetota bacterium]|nr:hypothetical protein [Actinomycetota bacterium]